MRRNHQRGPIVEKHVVKHFDSSERLGYIAENVIGLKSDLVVTITVNPAHPGHRSVMAVWESTNDCGVEYYPLERWQDTFSKVLLACNRR